MADEALRVLVLDASSVTRQGVAEVLGAAGVRVKTAANASIALNRVTGFDPSVIIVDLETLAPDAEAFFEALERVTRAALIALVAVGRAPPLQLQRRLWATLERTDNVGADAIGAQLCALLRRFELGKGAHQQPPSRRSGLALGEDVRPGKRHQRRRPCVICVGASTGGPAAIETILMGIGSAPMPGIVIAQHMTEGYIAPLASRLARATGLDVLEGATGMPVRPRSVILAPGNRHLELVARPTGYEVSVIDAAPVQRFRPSIDVLFQSAARTAASDAIGVILTGMQKDGAAGLKCMHDRGAYTIAQNEETCTVFSMPKAAIELEGVDVVAPLGEICGLLLEAVTSR